MELSERKQRILSAIVELYNRTGEPVGSRRLQELLPDSVSSATIRSEMAQLTELGFLEQPHTSAGRVPSHLGYRFYINRLLPGGELSPERQKQMEALLSAQVREPEHLLEQAGGLLANLSSCAALCVAPGGGRAWVRRVDMALMGRRMAMVALLTSHGLLKSKILLLEDEAGEEMRELFYRLAEEEILGRPLEELTPGAVQGLAARAGPHWLSMAALLSAVGELARESASAEVLVGEANLFQNPQLGENAAELTEALRSLSGWHKLADVPETDVRVVLGAEASLPHPALKQMSMILAPCLPGDARSGLLGIIGPVRLDYSHWIPGVRCFATLVARLMHQLTDAD
jgi:heat-inducible transcriptional repressor